MKIAKSKKVEDVALMEEKVQQMRNEFNNLRLRKLV